jgi:3-phosphoshikimate 1-carboxyvinyltransferase
MDVRVHLQGNIQSKNLTITGSKSETNRLLLLKALYPNLIINNASLSDDSAVMEKALSGNDAVIDVHHAGTAMRFLTAYFAIREGREVVLTGSARMKERPIAVLVNALRMLGADIKYQNKEGFPPLKIKGKKLSGGKVQIEANVSSQYITALLLIGSKLQAGLEITLRGEITSLPYIQMTLNLLAEVGITAEFRNNVITVPPKSEINNLKPQITVESDWSSASYYYSIIALSDVGTTLTLSSFKQNSLQGDSALVKIYEQFGVITNFEENTIILRKEHRQLSTIQLDLNNTPDIAQTIAVTCFGLGISCHLTGLHTLKIKETDRLLALKTELEKQGASVSITDDSITVESASGIIPGMSIATYHDHRMAMAFAPLAVKVPLIIQDAGVVSKSYPYFWDDLKKIGFSVDAQ